MMMMSGYAPTQVSFASGVIVNTRITVTRSTDPPEEYRFRVEHTIRDGDAVQCIIFNDTDKDRDVALELLDGSGFTRIGTGLITVVGGSSIRATLNYRRIPGEKLELKNEYGEAIREVDRIPTGVTRVIETDKEYRLCPTCKFVHGEGGCIA